MTENVDFRPVGNFIKSLREKNNMNQQEFAEKIGVTKGAVCQWENGSGIKTENLFDIAKYFNITVKELIDGQLEEDDDENYFERNFNLDEFERFDEVDDSNYEEVLEYLQRYKNVIKRFMFLYPLHETKKITEKQSLEYSKLLNYFQFDYEYAESISSFIAKGRLDNVVEELKYTYDINDPKEMDYTLRKLFYIPIKINFLSLLSYEKDDKAAFEYLELIGKEKRDELLTNYLPAFSDDEIEQSLVVHRLIEAGAKCLYTRATIMQFENYSINKDTFEHLSGSVVENKIIANKRNNFIKREQSRFVFEQYNPYSWKCYGRDEYDYLIDEETTNRIRDLVLLKNTDPKTYYKNMVERNLKNSH